MSDHVRTERQGAVLRLLLARPAKKNALTHAMYAALDAALADAEEEDGIRAVLLAGTGDDFTAGNDLNDFAGMAEDPDAFRDAPVLRLIRRLIRFPKPLVVAVQGFAVGFGTTALLHADVVVAAPGARFSLPFTRLGLVPEAASSVLLPRLAGRTQASDLLLTGEPFGTDRAAALGLASRVADDPRAEAEEVAQTLAALPAEAVQATKRLLRGDADDLQAAADREAKLFAEALRSPAHREALRAFAEKRPPRFYE